MPVQIADTIDRGDTRTLRFDVAEGTLPIDPGDPIVYAPADPDALTLTVRTPAGVSTVYVYGSSAIVREGTGVYRFDLTFATSGAWAYEWQSTNPTQVQGERLDVQPAPLDAVVAAWTYTTPTLLRAEIGTTETDLTDTAAVKLILTAEDITDELLGRYETDETTGRKIVEADVDAWQWTKLQRFATLLAAYIHANPTITTDRQYRTISGPDFSFSGPLDSGSWIPRSFISVLDQSRLRRLTTVAVSGRGSRAPWYSFSFNVDDND